LTFFDIIESVSSSRKIYYFCVLKYPFKSYLAGDNKFVAAVSVGEGNSSFILEKSHLETVVGAEFVVGLVEGPGEAVCDGRRRRP